MRRLIFTRQYYGAYRKARFVCSSEYPFLKEVTDTPPHMSIESTELGLHWDSFGAARDIVLLYACRLYTSGVKILPIAVDAVLDLGTNGYHVAFSDKEMPGTPKRGLIERLKTVRAAEEVVRRIDRTVLDSEDSRKLSLLMLEGAGPSLKASAPSDF
jgi:hypothetical protein